MKKLPGSARMWLRMYRADAWREQGKRCKYCLSPVSEREVTADHIHPRALGGPNVRSNIAATCRPCNILKADMPPRQFQKIIKGADTNHFPLKVQQTIRRINVDADRACKRILEYAGVS